MAQMGGVVSYCFFKEICLKNTGLQGSTLSGPRMTTGNNNTVYGTLYYTCISLIISKRVTV